MTWHSAPGVESAAQPGGHRAAGRAGKGRVGGDGPGGGRRGSCPRENGARAGERGPVRLRAWGGAGISRSMPRGHRC